MLKHKCNFIYQTNLIELNIPFNPLQITKLFWNNQVYTLMNRVVYKPLSFVNCSELFNQKLFKVQTLYNRYNWYQSFTDPKLPKKNYLTITLRSLIQVYSKQIPTTFSQENFTVTNSQLIKFCLHKICQFWSQPISFKFKYKFTALKVQNKTMWFFYASKSSFFSFAI